MNEDTRYPENLPISSTVGAMLKSDMRKTRNGRSMVNIMELQKTMQAAMLTLSHGRGVSVIRAKVSQSGEKSCKSSTFEFPVLMIGCYSSYVYFSRLPNSAHLLT